MSLAARIQQKLTQNLYTLYFEEFDEKIYLAPLTVEQRSKVQKQKDETKSQILAFTLCAFDAEGKPAATEAEAKALPDTIVGISTAIIMLLTQGAKHDTIDKFVASYNAEINPDIPDIDEEDLNPNQ
ncbi:hypothetical protein ABF107_002393 [Vibrio parahaemolyticus]|uniref:hypothetical protein n=1 Tax=Vibrio vulnificus TaxID=672 RepID=UPI001EE9D334|nr:hypothetical protein [Vibrio vulnificus]EIU7855891.1 hypothetical protein [Vibrio parahaemolyticus]ELA7145844.1 hypothetical protein [Vibrio parahaemolyticus]ELI5414495.1 hypothetical protein [Vibrio parahaemolyticus]ELI5417945.1 hypothetical protein [Vibrio parahaemolyticus]ELI5423075.1 hypothetical protein [Vibrio parahaemolyticus]